MPQSASDVLGVPAATPKAAATDRTFAAIGERSEDIDKSDRVPLDALSIDFDWLDTFAGNRLTDSHVDEAIEELMGKAG